MVERRQVFIVRNREGMMHAAMIVGHGIDRRVAPHQDEASPGCVKEHHLPVWRGRQMPAPDDLRVELRALRNIAHRNAEMSNRLDRHHITLPSRYSLFDQDGSPPDRRTTKRCNSPSLLGWLMQRICSE